MRRTRLAMSAAAVVATLAHAPGAHAANAVFGGSAKGGGAIVLNADAAGVKLRSAVIAWRAKCGDGQGLPFSTAVTATSASPGFSPKPLDLMMSRNGKGKFAGTQLFGLDLGDASAAVTVKLAGRLGATAASGTLSAEATILENATGKTLTTCRTGSMRWRASRSPGRIYGGKTSQGEPFVAKLDARRKRVTDVLVGWGSPCTPDGFMHYAEQLRNFTLASTGRFGDTWEQTVRGGDGSTRKFAYALTGRLTRRAARGTFRVAVTGTDAGGTTTLTCNTSAISWTASTG